MQEIRNGKFGPVEPFNGDALSKKLNDQEVDHVEVFNGTKDNIDPRYAEITSDYAFCFTVVKKFLLAKPYETQHEILTAKGKSFRTKKFTKKLHTDRKVEVFEMTPPEEQYGKYTVLKGIEGKNHEDLQEKIEVYLKSLMVMINEPLIECDSCKGTGVILDDKYEIK